jgi:hypothetical protein
MDLLSLPYALFVIATALLFHSIPGRFRPLFLTTASLLLYGYYSPASAAILVVSAMAVYWTACALEFQEQSDARRLLLFAGVLTVLLGYLLLIKFLPLLHARGRALGTGRILIALGVSYYTFKLMGYLIDVYWRKYPAWTDPVQFLAYATFFPQLSAGPIQRADSFAFPEDGSATSELMTRGLKRILLGVVKKTVVADQLASMIAYIDGLQPHYPNILWISAVLFALNLYFDFAALTDIAVGTAGVFGIKSPENFAYPFFAPSISQFWRRWHMSLTSWLTDYVFTPLRMTTRNLGNWGLVLSTTVTLVLIGLWHGINIGYLLFGLVHSVYLIVDSLSATARRRYYRSHTFADKLTDLIGPVFVFAMVAFSLVLFRAGTWPNIAYQMQHLLDGFRAPIASIDKLYYGFSRLRFDLVCLATFGALGIELWSYLRQKGGRLTQRVPGFSALPMPLRWAIYYVSIAIVVTLHQQSVHFIYVQF